MPKKASNKPRAEEVFYGMVGLCKRVEIQWGTRGGGGGYMVVILLERRARNPLV